MKRAMEKKMVRNLPNFLHDFSREVKNERKEQERLTWSNHIFLITVPPKIREPTLQVLMTQDLENVVLTFY